MGPYVETFTYDAFSNLRERESATWAWVLGVSHGFSTTYTNNRRAGWQHDSDGNVVDAGTDNPKFEFDASLENNMIEYPVDTQNCSLEHHKKNVHIDGDGDTTILHEDIKHYCGATEYSRDNYTYNLKSTVLDGAVVYQYRDMNGWGNGGADSEWKETRVFFNGKLLGTLKWGSVYGSNATPRFWWNHVDPMGTTIAKTHLELSNGHYGNVTTELDPSGADVGLAAPENPAPEPGPVQHWEYGSVEAVEWITVDGVSGPANHFPPGMVAAASRCPSGGCGPIRTEHGWEWWTAYADGYEGYIPMGAHYAGKGMWSWETVQERKRKARPARRPTLKRSTGKPSKSEIEKRRETANTGKFDNESDKDVSVDPPDGENALEVVRFIFRIAPLMERRVKMLGFSASDGEAIGKDLVYMLISAACVKAFRDAQLATPGEIMRDRGLLIANAGLLTSSGNNQALGISEDDRRALVGHIRKGSDAFTTYGETGPVYTFYNLWPSPNYSQRETSAHEAIHRSGVRSHWSAWSTVFGFYGHDLSGYEHYSAITKACMRPEE